MPQSPSPSPTAARPRRTPTPDLILGLSLIAVSLGFLAYTLGLSAQAAAWPRGVLVLLLVLAAAITVRALRSPAAPPGKRPEPVPAGGGESPAQDEAPGTEAPPADGEHGEWSRAVLRRPALTLAVVVGYVALLEIVGFLPATVLYLLGHLWFGGVRDWRILAGVVAGVVAFIQLLFVYQLSVPLPTGLLFE
ncbi:tripartite tricarboxylate transporter TctB family protein [Streptomonospora sp. PA3]|uniref:tripartite tricarboxylate transporter TctB family protein n=1 Tax=Streptomonospora sp. PA3 TaxID=2607326 RepID=UPI0012DBDDC3|nr:tripartite tricarboxylate transporter TctB family protein [Streptomonospora sp. PA3]MUL43799.1 tripartite tricarboxylate transporter TctB family protein [Streptomonospora sp. PA3]